MLRLTTRPPLQLPATWKSRVTETGGGTALLIIRVRVLRVKPYYRAEPKIPFVCETATVDYAHCGVGVGDATWFYRDFVT